jgi:hypothetical protein
MVQIRRQHRLSRTTLFFRSILALLRFLLLSAVIPSLFVLRHYWWTTGPPESAGTGTGTASIVLLPEGTGGVNANPTPENKYLRSPGSTADNTATATEQSPSSSEASSQPPFLPLHLVQLLQSLLLSWEEEKEQLPTTHQDATDTDVGNANTHDGKYTTIEVVEPRSGHFGQVRDGDFDGVELDHCHVVIQGILYDPTSAAWSKFTNWASPILNATVSGLMREQASLFTAHDAAIATSAAKAKATGIVTDTDGSETESSDSTTTPKAPKAQLSLMERVQQEFLLELLEIYATDSGLCDFSRYKPTVPSASTSTSAHAVENENDDADVLIKASGLLSADAAATKLRDAADLLELQGGQTDNDPDNQNDNAMLARLAVSIVAYQDIHHLQRLIQAIHLPHHVIVVHLDRRSSAAFAQQVSRMADEYENVVVLQFGTIVYKTDSVSMVNLRIMRWLLYDLELTFDYFVTLGGAAYPLQDAHDLAYSLQQTGRRIWLGELTNNGERVKSPQDSRLRRKRLVFTGGSFGDAGNVDEPMIPILSKRLPSGTFSGESLPDVIVESMNQKSVSGNQAIFAYGTVKELLDSQDVMELFARSKYGCCCCLEERNWIAALTMIGLQEEALEQASMWQVWGGAETCESSMKNAVLSRNASLCYRLEDATLDPPQMYIRGDETMDFLKDAKRRGFYFARKFHSDNPESMELLEDIRTDLHGNDFI